MVREVEVRCKDCGGSGLVQGKDTLEPVDCYECDGFGTVTEEEESEEDEEEDEDDCPACGGSGGHALEWKCSSCHGTGRNLERLRQLRADWEADQYDRDYLFDSWFIAEQEWGV